MDKLNNNNDNKKIFFSTFFVLIIFILYFSYNLYKNINTENKTNNTYLESTKLGMAMAVLNTEKFSFKTTILDNVEVLFAGLEKYSIKLEPIEVTGRQYPFVNESN